MDYVTTLTLAEENLLLSKATKDKTTLQELLDAKIDQYLADVKRELGQDDMANVLKEISDPVKLAIAKTALGL